MKKVRAWGHAPGMGSCTGGWRLGSWTEDCGHLPSLRNKAAAPFYITRVNDPSCVLAACPAPFQIMFLFSTRLRYEFWKKMFIHCTPEIERLFDNVGQSCSGNLPKVRQHGVAGVAGAVAGAAGPAIPGSPPPAAATSAAQAAAAQGPLGVQPKSPVPKA